MLELIVPDDLMTSPSIASQPIIADYSHEAQKNLGMQGALDAIQVSQLQTMYCMTTTTFNGTQTFDYQGRPFDSDADSDNQGDC